SQNSSQHKLSCRHCAAHYTGTPWLENQMSPSEPLDFLRTWYNMHILVAENGRMAIHTMIEL
ncbi:hypothetical protein NSB25_22865, partial [Acetatifactor muris]|uniref:hypothetical protein n=1 Tax=Acetatifactor muris TaxID=879566 RepID=UPI00214B87D7